MELIAYLSNGYPTITDSIAIAELYAQGGCDAIEVDFPGRNPYLESEYIADRMAQALKNCGDYTAYMDGIVEMRRRLPDIHFILLMYEDTLREIGFEQFVEFCKTNSLLDLILVGQTDGMINNRLMQEGLRVSCYVQFDLKPAEIEQAKNSNGFVYMQAKPAAGQVNPRYLELKDCIGFLRAQGIKRPIYCGVGIHTPDDVTMAKSSGADGVFVGSGILKLHGDHRALVKAIGDFKAKC